MRRICILYSHSRLRNILYSLVTLFFTLVCSTLALPALESRATSILRFSPEFVKDFLLLHHAWFACDIFIAIVSDGLYESRDSFARSPFNLLNLTMVCIGFANRSWLVSFNCLRVAKVVALLADVKGFEYLKEMLSLLKKSGRVVSSILIVMFTCLVFFSLLTSNLVVSSIFMFRFRKGHRPGAEYVTAKEYTRSTTLPSSSAPLRVQSGNVLKETSVWITSILRFFTKVRNRTHS